VAVAVPGGPSMTALSVSGPESRVTWAAVERIAPLLREVARALAGRLDAHGAMA
jgi:IclR family acetate operon transcriptional repressor